MTKNDISALESVFTELDNLLGDTDPYFEEDCTDEEIRDLDPLFWACRELSRVLNNARREQDERAEAKH